MSRFMKFFLLVCLFHFSEHVAQVIQAYGLGWPVHEARGILGYFFPWLAHSETLHFGYALFMFGGMFAIQAQDQYFHLSKWFSVATTIQLWHLIEHYVLLIQAIDGTNMFGAPQPISFIQLFGFFNGNPESGFGGLLTMSHFGLCDCAGASPGTFHNFTPLILLVRRLEVHMLYNLAVFTPMVIAIILQRRQNVRA